MPNSNTSFFHRHRVAIVLTGIVLLVLTFAAWWFMQSYKRGLLFQEADTAFNANNVDDAIAKTSALLQEDPENVKALVAQSFALAQKGSLEFKEKEYGAQAAAVAMQAIQLNSNSSEAYRALGYANEIQQKYAEAHAAYQKSVLLNPKNALALFGDAHAYDLQGDLVKAEAGYKASIAVDEKTYPAHTGLGRIYSAQGEADSAIAEFKTVYAYSPNAHSKAEAAFSIGMLLLSKKDNSLARGYFEKAIALDDKYPSGWYGLGVAVYAQAAETSSLSAEERTKIIFQSIDVLNHATALNPNQSVAFVQLSQDFQVIGKKDIALAALKQGAKVAPKDITLGASEKSALLSRIASLQSSLVATK